MMRKRPGLNSSSSQSRMSPIPSSRSRSLHGATSETALNKTEKNDLIYALPQGQSLAMFLSLRISKMHRSTISRAHQAFSKRKINLVSFKMKTNWIKTCKNTENTFRTFLTINITQKLKHQFWK